MQPFQLRGKQILGKEGVRENYFKDGESILKSWTSKQLAWST